MGTGAGRRGGLCVGLSADSEYSIKPREMNSFFSSLGNQTRNRKSLIQSKIIHSAIVNSVLCPCKYFQNPLACWKI